MLKICELAYGGLGQSLGEFQPDLTPVEGRGAEPGGCWSTGARLA